jgi:cytochrome c biogenesis protein CcmG/thiol:disulfide interchange protein DsbE
VPIYGLNYKDAPSQARRWLQQHGDPYKLSVVDYEGKVGIDYGVYGVPETFVIDKHGIIRHKVIGPISSSILRECLTPLVAKLEQEDPQTPPQQFEKVEGCA